MQGALTNKDTIAKILIADSNKLFREKVKQIIADNFDFTLTSETSSEHDVLSELGKYPFDILILDLELLDGSGLNVLKKIRSIDPDIPVLILSMFPVEQYEESVFRAGAHGYVSKVNLSVELISALHQIFQGKKYFNLRCNDNSGEK